ncbi:DNA polymerase epsilon catalytic subunit A, partial [Larimichthys crocea]
VWSGSRGYRGKWWMLCGSCTGSRRVTINSVTSPVLPERKLVMHRPEPEKVNMGFSILSQDYIRWLLSSVPG